jgi:hypothetical protein
VEEQNFRRVSGKATWITPKGYGDKARAQNHVTRGHCGNSTELQETTMRHDYALDGIKLQ